MTNIQNNIIKSKKRRCLSELPFEQYLAQLTDAEYREIVAEIRSSADISSDATIYRLRRGCYRPDKLKCQEIAKVISRHKGGEDVTGENLFPAEFYFTKEDQ